MSQEYRVKKIQLDEISQTWTESIQSLLKFSHNDFSPLQEKHDPTTVFHHCLVSKFSVDYRGAV